MTMDQIKQEKSASSKLGHILKIVVMCLSFGFIFPHVLTESTEIAKPKPNDEGKGKTQ
jgi:hypothetical protein